MPAIPWSTALFMFKKLMPVVIDQAPEILKSFERRRTAPPRKPQARTSCSCFRSDWKPKAGS